jgi:predicted MFS family arabinose efflux permease/quinol monooxygenase YgiN
MTDPADSRPSLLDPLRSRLFLMVWIANMASNVGTQIQSVGEKWQMAHLTSSPLLVALIETGTTLPVLLFGLSAGAFADILDRRRLLLGTQVFMLACAAALSGLTFMHLVTPAALLGISFLIGVGSALSMPAFQAIVPELLDRRRLPEGVALNSAGFNLSRAAGPALGGLVVGLLGAGWAFCLNAVSFLAVVLALLAWRRRPPTSSLPGERFLGALKVGFRYARHSRPFQVILLRALGYSWFSGVIFSLLPTLAIHDLKLGSEAFGALMGCIGAGAVLAVFLLGPLRRRFETNQILAGFSLLAALAQGLIAWVPHTPTVAVCLFCAGMSWLVVLSTINTAIQLSVPPWVKARAFGAYHTVWGGAMALGAAFWGEAAVRFGLRAAWGLSAAGMVAALAVIGRLRISAFDQELDLSPHHDPPHAPTAIPPEAGPVLVQAEYRVPDAHRAEFLEAMAAVRRLRLRDGAMRWALFEEPDRQEAGTLRFQETYLSTTMGEHLRQHHRATAQDREVLAGAYRLTHGGRPDTRHLVVVEDQDSSLLQRIWHGWIGE